MVVFDYLQSGPSDTYGLILLVSIRDSKLALPVAPVASTVPARQSTSLTPYTRETTHIAAIAIRFVRSLWS